MTSLSLPSAQGRTVPVWALPVLAVLPLWAVLYGGLFGERSVSEVSLVDQGEAVYRSAGCSGCHGTTGWGSGSVPGMGEVARTFPDFADHERWILEGSVGRRGSPYGALGRVASGGMPSFAGQLSAEEVRAVACFERIRLAGEPAPAVCEVPSATPSALEE